jgi:hypothetical protein
MQPNLQTMIRTAIPFGYFFIALFLLAALIAGVGIFVWGWHRHSRPAKWLGAVLSSLIAIIVVSEIAFGAALEWNPQIASDSQVVGIWTDNTETIRLASDYTFFYQTASWTKRGTWTRYDWNLDLHSDMYSSTMRFVQFRGQYRLMTHPPEDTDAWDGDLGLQLTQRH